MTGENYAVDVDLDGRAWLMMADSQFVMTLEPHEAASLCFVFAHEEHGLHGFCINTATGTDADVTVTRGWWKREPHHELDKTVIVRRDPPGGDPDP